MSESENFDFREDNDPELDAILYDFTNNAYQYYNWLENKVYDNKYVLGFNHEAAGRADQLSASFARTAVGVGQYFQNHELTRNLLSAMWSSDEANRGEFFVMLASEFKADPLDEDDIERKIAHFQRESVLNPDDFFKFVKYGYGHSLLIDVTKLLNSLLRAQETELIPRLPDIPLTTPESSHKGLAATRMVKVRNEIATRILHGLVDGVTVKYIP